MTEQHKNKYKIQYREETSQIHAPADLIRRTRQAVAEEETRLRQLSEEAVDIRAQEQSAESEQQEVQTKQIIPNTGMETKTGKETETKKQEKGTVGRSLFYTIGNCSVFSRPQRCEASFVNTCNRACSIFHSKIYRWGLAVAAAAVLVLILNMSVVLQRNKSGGSSADYGVAEENYEASMSADEAAEIEDGIGDDGIMPLEAERTDDVKSDLDAEAERAEEGRSTKAEPTEDCEIIQKIPSENNSMAQYDSAEYRDDQYVDLEESRGTSIEDATEKKYSGTEDSLPEIVITEVNQAPDFCDDTDTERIVRKGITFYITEDRAVSESDDTIGHATAEGDIRWKAYVQYRGRKYVITGPASDQEEFLEQGLELLREM